MANKISFEILEKTFRKTYPEGEIFFMMGEEKKKIASVTFSKHGKVYKYRYSNHANLWKKLNLPGNLIYTYEYENAIRSIKDIQNKLQQKKVINEWTNEEIFLTPEVIAAMKNELFYQQAKIKDAILI